ncbi:MAG: CAP domain-containing protein [Hyphomicrobiales bacterium]|nr:CAP domain-containing protein [Hyphomicrobiales bacterium]
MSVQSRWLFHSGSIATVAALVAALAGCAAPPPSSEPTFYQNLARPDAAVDAAAAASMISGYRSNNGLPPVSVDPELMRMASEQAHAMAAHDKMEHDVGRPFRDRIRSSPFRNSVAVENISAGYHTLAEAFSGWRDSPPHRANMLNASVSRLGIAAVYAPGSKYKVFWALILAGPAGHHG